MKTKEHYASSAQEFVDLISPWTDILLEEVIPKYLTIRDFLNLGAVSKRFRSVLHPSSLEGNKVLGKILMASCSHSHIIDEKEQASKPCFIEQLPTIGNRSVEESLAKNALLVAHLIKPSLRRRCLVTIPANLREPIQRKLLARFKSKRHTIEDIRRIAKNHALRSPIYPRTMFAVVNLSGRNVYCHWIDFEGTILKRDGDCIPPCHNSDERHPEPFGIRCTDVHFELNDVRLGPALPITNFHSSIRGIDHVFAEGPEHIFAHKTFPLHSFALCHEEGGPPFAIYQLRRGWMNGPRNTFQRMTMMGITHIHAISILPDGTIKELYCDQEGAIESTEDVQSFTTVYHFGCRETGRGIPFIDPRTQSSMCSGDASMATESYPLSNALPETLAKAYYGMNVLNTRKHSLNRVNPYGEAVYDDFTMQES